MIHVYHLFYFINRQYWEREFPNDRIQIKKKGKDNDKRTKYI